MMKGMEPHYELEIQMSISLSHKGGYVEVDVGRLQWKCQEWLPESGLLSSVLSFV
jgi:hypothetical protein